MKYPIFSIRDRRTGFMTPTLDQNISSAVRNFEHACMNTDSLMYSHADDYSLYQIGEFDTETGVIVVEPQPKFIVDALNFSAEVE